LRRAQVGKLKSRPGRAWEPYSMPTKRNTAESVNEGETHLKRSSEPSTSRSRALTKMTPWKRSGKELPPTRSSGWRTLRKIRTPLIRLGAQSSIAPEVERAKPMKNERNEKGNRNRQRQSVCRRLLDRSRFEAK